jgi:iron complex outermembrane receptor protein
MSANIDSLATAPAPTLDVALRHLPFVLVRTNSRGEAELSIRGSESRTPTVLLDGLPLTLGWDSRSDPSLIPLSGASVLRITRSTGSLLAGPNAVGGVIEIDAARAVLADRALNLAAGTDHLGSATVTAGVSAPLTLGSARLALRGGATVRDRSALARASDVADPGAPDGERINSDARETDAFASARIQSAMGAYASVSFLRYDAERGVQPELHVESPRYWRYPNQDRTFAGLSAGTGVRSTPWGIATVDGSLGLNRGETDISVFGDNTYGELTMTDGLTGLACEPIRNAPVSATYIVPAISRVGTLV